MSQHTKSVVILFSLLVSISLLSINSYGQGGSAEKPSTPPSTKPPTKSSQPVKRSTTSARGSRSASSKPNTDTSSTAKESDESSATLEETMNLIGRRLTVSAFYRKIGVDDNYSDYEGTKDLPGSPAYKIDGCTVTLKRTYKFRDTEGHSRIVIPFADIDPRTIKSETLQQNPVEYNVRMQAVNPTLKLLDVLVGSPVTHDVSGSAVTFTLIAAEYQKTLESNFKHAVKLCGGKASQF